MKELSDEISKLLFSTFSDGFPFLNKNEIIRIWSLDFQWFNPDDSILLFSHLLDKKWIINSKNYFSSNPNLNLIQPQLSWKPNVNDILNISEFNIPSGITINPVENEKIIILKTTHLDKDDSNFEDEKMAKLLNYVSKKSELSKREVIRRSERKKMALGPISLWMAVCLLAREQGLDMNKIIDIIDNN